MNLSELKKGKKKIDARDRDRDMDDRDRDRGKSKKNKEKDEVVQELTCIVCVRY